MHFTGKERDSESGLDYFGARFDSSSIGRFMSPDPSPRKVSVQRNPQDWNLYAYARNNPIVLVDPTGEETEVYTLNGHWSRQAFGNVAGKPNPFGHTSIRIKNSKGDWVYTFEGDANGKLHLSKVPGGLYFKNPNQKSNDYGPGVFDQDPKREVSGQVLDWKTNGKQEKATQKYLEQFLAEQNHGQDHGDYSEFTNNCTQNATKALQAGGLDLSMPETPAGLAFQLWNLDVVSNQELRDINGSKFYSTGVQEDRQRQCMLGNPAGCNW
jgi:RHS repeat-associated protein